MMQGENRVKKIFVVGCPRSGTTLVQEILGAHNDVYVCKETHFFRRIRRRGKKRLLDHLLLSQRNVLNTYDFIRTHNEFLEQHDPSGVKSLRSAVLFFDRMMTLEARAADKSAWVEKTPLHVFDIRLIDRYIPSVQFVHVIRDGRDVVASLVDAAQKFPRSWEKFSNLEIAIDLYNRSLAESLRYCHSEGHIFVHYERILDDVEGTRRRLYTLLGLNGESSGLNLKEIHQKVIRSDEGWKNGHGGEIKDTRLVKFNRIFDDEQKRSIDSKVKGLPSELREAFI